MKTYTENEIKEWFHRMEKKYSNSGMLEHLTAVEFIMFDNTFNAKDCLEQIKEKKWDFMFEVIETGEQFFVECYSLNEAKVILEMSGFEEGELKYCRRYTVAEAEAIGLDTY